MTSRKVTKKSSGKTRSKKTSRVNKSPETKKERYNIRNRSPPRKRYSPKLE